MIDTSKIKEGDTVVFRNGGKSVVRNSVHNELYIMDWYTYEWNKNGLFRNTLAQDLDIVEIIPKPAPVVHEFYINYYKCGFGECVSDTLEETKVAGSKDVTCHLKITMTDGVPTIERIEP